MTGDSSAWPLVLIDWEDSSFVGVGWQDPMEFSDAPVCCRSVGWLVLDGNHTKAIMPHRNDQGDSLNQGGGIIKIPTRCISRMVRLVEVTSSSGTASESACPGPASGQTLQVA